MEPPSVGTSPDLPQTWIESDRQLARRFGRPLQSFLAVEAGGGIMLVIATVVALVWANSPWSASYETLFQTHLTIDIGGFSYDESLVHVINDGLMTLFFFVVGLEIKREWVAGELRDRRAAVLPAVAALGGMVVPAAIYAAINAGGPGSAGWGIPMATDIAFALGVVAVLGSRVPAPLKIFLLTLAIVDDIGAILVIAVFYTEDLSLPWLAAAGAAVLLVVACRRAEVRYHVVYVVLGAAMWFFVLESGVHATIAGVVMGLLTPALPYLSAEDTQTVVDELEGRDDLTAADVHRVSILISEAVPLTERLEHLLHPWTSYLIVPVFALANAGIELTRRRAHQPVAHHRRRHPRPHRGQDRRRQPVLLDRRAPQGRLAARRGAVLPARRAWRCSPASGSRCRCSSPGWRSPGASTASSCAMPRSASWSHPWSPRSEAPRCSRWWAGGVRPRSGPARAWRPGGGGPRRGRRPAGACGCRRTWTRAGSRR